MLDPNEKATPEDRQKIEIVVNKKYLPYHLARRTSWVIMDRPRIIPRL